MLRLRQRETSLMQRVRRVSCCRAVYETLRQIIYGRREHNFLRYMKTLIINGSPRPAGKISRMLTMAGEIVAGDTEVIDVYSADIKQCTGCMSCRATGVCVLPPDDAHRAAGLIREADLIIVGTPTYWANMSGGLKNLFDRLVPVFMGETPRGIPVKKLTGKRAIVVTACTTPFPFNVIFGQSRGSLRAVREVLLSGGIKTSSVVIPGTKRMEYIPEKYIARLTALILKYKKRFAGMR